MPPSLAVPIYKIKTTHVNRAHQWRNGRQQKENMGHLSFAFISECAREKVRTRERDGQGQSERERQSEWKRNRTFEHIIIYSWPNSSAAFYSNAMEQWLSYECINFCAISYSLEWIGDDAKDQSKRLSMQISRNCHPEKQRRLLGEKSHVRLNRKQLLRLLHNLYFNWNWANKLYEAAVTCEA